MNAQTKFYKLRRRSHAKGFTLFQVTLALAASSLALTYEINRNIESGRDKSYTLFGQSVGTLQNSANAALSKYYGSFINAPDVSAAIEINLAPDGTAPRIVNIADWRHPTISDLRNLEIGLPPNFKNIAPNGGRYRIELNKSPVGCTPNNCNIEGLVWVDKPITVGGLVDNDRAAIAVESIGADGGRSVAGTSIQEANTIYGWKGRWNVANPVSNAGAIVAARIGYGANAFAPYFRIDGTKQMAADGNFGGHSLVNAKQVLTVMKTVDAVCEDEGAIAGGIISGKGAALVCSGSKWQAAGTKTDNVGAACSPEGKTANSPDGQTLVCKNGNYVKLSKLIGNSLEMSRRVVRDGDLVVKPNCEYPSQADFSFDMVSTAVDFTKNPPMAAQYIRAEDYGSSWGVLLRLRADDGSEVSGNAYSLAAMMHIECRYP
ncbi:hypothetical protein [Janthinobacterium sp. FW305-128]|uniref:hypothetical protein n=1 Tax=Janthinobacterium sp. FW305-128 TaxID=2775055 RepID=UPI001E34702C|nr:hypothetical protein [Janthinobacterium sp. FW305-128]MCC7684709.1 hypothetical protein [Janthinobacterium sp. FW305-128]